MKTLTTTGVIFGHKNFGPYHKLVFLYTEELGKIKAIAKGARKITSKFTGHLETMNSVEVCLYSGPKNIIITEINTVKNLKGIRGNFEKITEILEIAELTNKMIYEKQSLEKKNLIKEETIKEIKKTKKPKQIKQGYNIKLLNKMGLIPDLKSINTKLEKKYLKFLKFIQENPLKKIENINLKKEEENKINEIINKLSTQF